MRSDIKDLYITISRLIATSDFSDELIQLINESIATLIKSSYTDAQQGGEFDDTIQVEKSRIE